MMKKLVGILICTLIIAMVILPVTGTINVKITRGKNVLDNQTGMQFVPGEFIVKLKKDVAFSDDKLLALNDKYKVYNFEKIFNKHEGTTLDNIYLLYVPVGSDIISIVKEYSLCSDVIYVEPNNIGKLCTVPNDESFWKQWYLDNTGQFGGIPDADIDAPEAWDITTGNSEIIIASVDTGVDYTHPDLSDRIWENSDEIPNNSIDDDDNGFIDDICGWDFAENDNAPLDRYGHGTMCAGVHGMMTDNIIGGAGVNWNCKTMVLRCYAITDCEESWYAQGIVYAVDNGADIINIEIAYEEYLYPYPYLLEDAVNYAYGEGAFIVAAAGNMNTSNHTYPAAFDNVTAVAATNNRDERCDEDDWIPPYASNYGDWVDIAAPGSKIFSTLPTYEDFYWHTQIGYPLNYFFEGGTSLAAPIVAGVAALLLSKAPSLSPDELKALICGNFDPYNSSYYIGTGRINAQKALTALLTPPNPPNINGPTTGKKETMLEYTFNAVDPNNFTVKYIIDWGDGKSDTTNLNPSGVDVKVKHSWSEERSFLIKVKAEDKFGNVGLESSLSITIPRFRAITWNSLLMKVFEHFSILERILTLQ